MLNFTLTVKLLLIHLFNIQWIHRLIFNNKSQKRLNPFNNNDDK